MLRVPGLAAAAALMLLGACTGPSSSASEGLRYVAIGDSFVSGPGIPVQDVEAPECVRSDHNYPQLLAAELENATLVDVSCGGATTGTVQNGLVRAANPLTPQVNALTPSTKLVTVGIGGNDENLILSMYVHCLLKDSATEAACREYGEDTATSVYPETRDRVAGVLDEVKARSPQARVLLVGYLRIVPPAGDCEVLQMTRGEPG